MSKLKLTTLATQDDSASVPADTIVNGTAKAWVNFNGTGVVAIRRAFNVSSITDNGTGNYAVNFATAMTDANYSANVGASFDGGGFAGQQNGQVKADTTPTAFTLNVVTSNSSNAVLGDGTKVYVAIFS